jgi:hypothetical protein
MSVCLCVCVRYIDTGVVVVLVVKDLDVEDLQKLRAGPLMTDQKSILYIIRPEYAHDTVTTRWLRPPRCADGG